MPSCKMPYFCVAVGTNIERVVVTTISTKIIKILQILVFCYLRMNYPTQPSTSPNNVDHYFHPEVYIVSMNSISLP